MGTFQIIQHNLSKYAAPIYFVLQFIYLYIVHELELPTAYHVIWNSFHWILWPIYCISSRDIKVMWLGTIYYFLCVKIEYFKLFTVYHMVLKLCNLVLWIIYCISRDRDWITRIFYHSLHDFTYDKSLTYSRINNRFKCYI